MSRRRTVAVVVAAVIALGACGGGGGSGSGRGGIDAERAANGKTTSTTSGGAADGSGAEGSTEAAAEASRAAEQAGRGGSGGSAGGTTDTTLFDPATHPYAPKDPAPFRQGAPQHPNRDTVPVALQVESASCAKLGGVLRVTVISEADVDVAMIIAYSDNEAHESQKLGTTGNDGRLVLDVPIGADAPTGTADLLVVAGAPDGRRNHYEKKLQIVKASGSCP